MVWFARFFKMYNIQIVHWTRNSYIMFNTIERWAAMACYGRWNKSGELETTIYNTLSLFSSSTRLFLCSCSCRPKRMGMWLSFVRWRARLIPTPLIVLKMCLGDLLFLSNQLDAAVSLQSMSFLHHQCCFHATVGIAGTGWCVVPPTDAETQCPISYIEAYRDFLVPYCVRLPRQGT